jgi:sec-independent protein translocase protein TatB
MLSIPHMIVVFVVVLVVFGPQKLPELARSFGKLMAEFRKASNDFKNAFEEEMRDLERQARIAELKKQVAETNAAAAAIKNPVEAVNRTPAGTSEATEAAAGSQSAEAPVLSPVAESVPRLDGANGETAVPPKAEDAASEPVTESSPAHDQQQPA